MRRILAWIPALVWMMVIFAFSHQPALKASTIDWQDFIIRKIAHITEYFILTLLYLWSLRKYPGFSRKKALLTAGVLAFLYAVTDEYHQTFISGREGRARDVGIDSLGVCLAAIFSRNW